MGMLLMCLLGLDRLTASQKPNTIMRAMAMMDLNTEKKTLRVMHDAKRARRAEWNAVRDTESVAVRSKELIKPNKKREVHGGSAKVEQNLLG